MKYYEKLIKDYEEWEKSEPKEEAYFKAFFCFKEKGILCVWECDVEVLLIESKIIKLQKWLEKPTGELKIHGKTKGNWLSLEIDKADKKYVSGYIEDGWEEHSIAANRTNLIKWLKRMMSEV
ncbi:MAG: hypothetical protein GY853_13745 [PVC group bacterium]|nr:hypothetical protein [PVC group bacterium]